MKDGTLFPDEILKYEPFVIREALNNCIAHQDYSKSGRINVIEIEDEQLIFTNYGTFIPGSVEKVVSDDAPEEYYRNKFLATAMFNLKMVETAGGGIKKMFKYQKERFFPMPEYDLRDQKVKVVVTGKVLDMGFARVLANNPNLSLEDIMLLDKVQKKKTITKSCAEHLKSMSLIEGRRPNYFISSKLAQSTKNRELKVQHIKQKGFDDDHYKDMIIQYLDKYKEANRKDFDSLLYSKLPDILDDKQKNNKISNLLGFLRRAGMIENKGTTNKPKYIRSKSR
nr:ATP-binding protein [uncultured Methanolobus sp.]